MHEWMSRDRIRTFVAVDLDIEVVRRVADATRSLHAAVEEAGMRVGWVSPAHMHVTLKFVGDVAREVTPAMGDRLSKVGARQSAFDLEVKGAGAFPDTTHPRVLWIGLRSDGALERLAANVDAALEEIGFAREKRVFHAHVTIGRVKDETRDATTLLSPYADTSFGNSRVREIVVYESRLKREGAEYVTLARSKLASAMPTKPMHKEPAHAG